MQGWSWIESKNRSGRYQGEGVEKAVADPKKKMVHGTLYAGVDYNLIKSTPDSTQTHVLVPWATLYARVDLNPMPESTLSSIQGLRIWPQEWKNPLDMGTL